MKNSEILVERNAANDDQVKVIELLTNQHEFVNENQPVALLEGSKAIFELISPNSGYINLLFSENDFVKVGAVFAEVAPNPSKFILQKKQSSTSHKMSPPDNFTLPAYELLKQCNLDIELFKHFELVTTEVIKTYQLELLDQKIDASKQKLTASIKDQRVIIAGAGRAANQLLSVFNTYPNTTIIGFVDDTDEKQNTTHLGYPILGKVSELKQIAHQYKANALICSIGDVEARKRFVELACELEIPLANAIHPSVVVDGNLQIGGGNYIGPNTFIGVNASIGYGNFISSNTVIEHDCTIGNCISAGPSISLSGSVTIATGCVLGSGIVVEPYNHIGFGCKIASGCIITQSIKANSSLKMKTNYTLS